MIEVVKVLDRITANERSHDILKGIVDGQTLLALSGGASPDYRKMIVEPADLVPGAICLADERYGAPSHDDSNEILIRNSGLVDFLEVRNVKFYKILRGEEFEKTAQDYRKVISELFSQFPKKVGIMGIGVDSHTAGIFAGSAACASADLVVAETIEDRFPKRITLTIRALEQFNFFVILAFGEEKREALTKLFDENENDLVKYPAIFYRKSSAKSYLITDLDIGPKS